MSFPRHRRRQELVPLASNRELGERPIGELLKQLANETTTLVRQELELAKAEVREKGQHAGPAVGMWGAAAAAGLMAFGSLTACFILALDGAIPNWLAALLVAIIYMAVAGLLYARGKRRVSQVGSPVPEQTVETLKEDVQWAKHPTIYARK
jgi:hypothetical protein